MTFLGRKLTGNFQGEIITDTKKRPQGVRIKHRMKKNSLKMHDKWSVLRVEMTINNPREFKIYRKVERCGKGYRILGASLKMKKKYLPMNYEKCCLKKLTKKRCFYRVILYGLSG